MSRRGKHYADEMASWCMRNATGITKSEGTHAALIKTFAPYGEIIAGIEKTLADNDRILSQTRQAHESVVKILERAQALDAENLAGVEARYSGESSYVPFENWITGKAGGLVKRELTRINGNGHAPQE